MKISGFKKKVEQLFRKEKSGPHDAQELGGSPKMSKKKKLEVRYGNF